MSDRDWEDDVVRMMITMLGVVEIVLSLAAVLVVLCAVGLHLPHI